MGVGSMSKRLRIIIFGLCACVILCAAFIIYWRHHLEVLRSAPVKAGETFRAQSYINNFLSSLNSTKIAVTDSSGKDLDLNFATKPILFFAWWCPHCSDLLGKLNKEGLINSVYLVNIDYPGMKNSNAKIISDLVSHGINANYYIYKPSNAKDEIPVPVLLYNNKGKGSCVIGDDVIVKFLSKSDK